MTRVLIVSGAPSKTSRLTGLISFAGEQLQRHNVTVELQHVVDLPPEDLVFARFDSPAVQAANELVARADGIIVASPVYKASYTGVLKLFLDALPQKALAGKIVLPLVIGGTIAHLLSVEYALKPVLSVLGARHVLGGVFAVDQWVSRTADGGFELSAELVDRLTASIGELVEALQGLESRKTSSESR